MYGDCSLRVDNGQCDHKESYMGIRFWYDARAEGAI